MIFRKAENRELS